MFTAEDIQKKLKQQPFQPVRILTSSGERYDIYHPDLVLIGRRHLIVGTASEDNPAFFEQSSMLSIMHITAIEGLATPTPSGKNGQAS